MPESVRREGWIRKSVLIAAVPDTLRNRWTLRVSPKGWHLSASNVPLAGALVGNSRSHHDRRLTARPAVLAKTSKPDRVSFPSHGVTVRLRRQYRRKSWTFGNLSKPCL